ncbi:hypothetical protein LSH36_44g16002 [Paralvinella palmiformis]|uniref:Uncharacterized protein n=1 Tax=Paralvinella palmiformis TaxID=53620 RepID=A0AAD9NEU1_9ANNE|nr:hypothetical protein LSH36_44g16002 [Paralvinella palmiformis]
MTSYKKHSEIQKACYYVWYLGWKECWGLAGREFTEAIVKDLVIRRKNEQPLKLTLEVSSKELKIYQVTKGKFGRTEKVKFPTVHTKDVTYAVQGLPPDEDVVACIYIGYNPTTRRAVHVHVYRFDSPTTARVFTDHLTDIIRLPEHEDRIRAVEADLVSRGEIGPRPRSFIRTYDMASTAAMVPYTGDVPTDDDKNHPPERNDDPFYEEKEEKMESLAAELKQRLGNRSEAPLLLPPQDYDTIRRVRGNLNDPAEYEARKCKNQDIVGQVAVDEEENDGFNDDDGRGSGSSGRVGSTSREGVLRRQLSGGYDIRENGIDGWLRESGAARRSPISPRYSGSTPAWITDHRTNSGRGTTSPRRTRSPSPRRYDDHLLGLAQTARPSDHSKHPREPLDNYSDRAQYIVPVPAGTLPPPGVVGPPASPDNFYNYGRLPRQLSTESSSQSNPYGNVSPKIEMSHPKDNKKKNKKGRSKDEPPPDYTLHPSDIRKLDLLYA